MKSVVFWILIAIAAFIVIAAFTSGAFINLSASYNKREVPGLDVLKEDFFQFHLNLSMKSSWFIKRKFY